MQNMHMAMAPADNQLDCGIFLSHHELYMKKEVRNPGKDLSLLFLNQE